jgi:hypothetical protein
VVARIGRIKSAKVLLTNLPTRSKRARQGWNDNYSRFEQQGPDGLAGKMTSRAAAHIRRLAMLTDEIELEHFQAAEKLWNYCEESAMYLTPWRVCFEWRDGHAYEVEIVDYH